MCVYVCASTLAYLDEFVWFGGVGPGCRDLVAGPNDRTALC